MNINPIIFTAGIALAVVVEHVVWALTQYAEFGMAAGLATALVEYAIWVKVVSK